MFDPWQQSKLNSGIAKMKEYTVTSPPVESIDDLKKLAGVTESYGETLSQNGTGRDFGKIQRERNIQPGTDEFFRLWFARPDLTGESPFDK